jgi:hypothetical protein
MVFGAGGAGLRVIATLDDPALRGVTAALLSGYTQADIRLAIIGDRENVADHVR